MPGLHLNQGGHLVSLPVGADRPLDGFWQHGRRLSPTLLVIVHGMYSDFYRSRLKKAFLREAPPRGCDVLTFNNRGAGLDVRNERFEDCLEDIGAALSFGRRRGYRRFVLAGHSTGCQKVVYAQARLKPRGVRGAILLAPADDCAIFRRDLGQRYNYWIGRAREMCRRRKGDEQLGAPGTDFSARRFLSAADPRRTEARIFQYDGPMTNYRRLRLPVLAVFGSLEEYAVLPVGEMGDRLRERSRSRDFRFLEVHGADHGFHGREVFTARRCLEWAGRHGS